MAFSSTPGSSVNGIVSEDLSSPDSLYNAYLAQYTPVSPPVSPREFWMHVQYSEPGYDTRLRVNGTYKDPFDIDPDLSSGGAKTVELGRRIGEPFTTKTITGLNVIGGRWVPNEVLMQSKAGRDLLMIASRNREGTKRGFLESFGEISTADAPFGTLFASQSGSLSDARVVRDAMEKLQKNEPITNDEAIKVTLHLAHAKREDEGTWLAATGTILRQAPGFMTEFLMTGGLYGGIRTAAAKTVAKDSIGIAMTRSSKVLTRELVEHKALMSAAGKTAADVAKYATASRGALVDYTSDIVFRSTMLNNPMYKGIGESALRTLAKQRAEYEVGSLIARTSHGPLANGLAGFGRYLKDHTSRALLDFGSWGTEESTRLWTNFTAPGRAFKEAFGAFFVEAPIAGAMMFAPNQFVVKPIIDSSVGGAVSKGQMSLATAALLRGDTELMEESRDNSFGSISLAQDLLEYVSESAGRGFGPFVRGIGMSADKAAAKVGMKYRLVTPASSAILGETAKGGEDVVVVGGKIREWVAKRFGTPQTAGRNATDLEMRSVVRSLGITSETDRRAVESAVLRRDISGLPDTLKRMFSDNRDFTGFISKSVKETLAREQSDHYRRAFITYMVGSAMARRGIGPGAVMNLFDKMGYHGVFGEIFEERYADVAKGLLALNELPDRKEFATRMSEAASGLWPGFSQFMAEMVGFSVPMVSRMIAMRVQAKIGGAGRFARMSNRLEALRDITRIDNVVQGRWGDYFRWDERLAAEDDKAIADTEAKLTTARESENAEEIEALEANLEQLQTVKKRRLERHGKFVDKEIARLTGLLQKVTDPSEITRINETIGSLTRARNRGLTVEDRARSFMDDVTAVQILSNATLANDNLYNRTPVVSPEQADRTLTGHIAMVDYASELARDLFEAGSTIEGEDLGTFRWVAHKLIGFTAGVVTGDFRAMMTNPVQWTARDLGLTRQVCDALKTGYAREFRRQASALMKRSVADTTVNGPTGNFFVTRDEILNATDAAFSATAKKIMASHLAVQQLRAFSMDQARDVAAEHVASEDGYTVTVEDDEVVLYKLSDGKVKFLTSDEMYGLVKAEADRLVSDFGMDRADAVATAAESSGYRTTDDGRFYAPSRNKDGQLFDRTTRVTLDEFVSSNSARVEKARRDITEAAVDILVNRTVGVDTSLRSRLVNIVRLTDPGEEHDGIDYKMQEAALRMIGLEDLVYTVRLTRDGASLHDVITGSAVARVNMDIVKYIATKESVDEVGLPAFEAVARELGMRFDGTGESLAKRNEKIFRLSKAAMSVVDESNVYFVGSTENAENYDPRLHGGNAFTIRVTRNQDMTYTVKEGLDAEGNPIGGTYRTKEELVEAMREHGFIETDARIVFVQAKVIECDDMFTMLRELNLVGEYLRACDEDNVHPMLRKDENGKWLNDENDAAAEFERELALAACWNGDEGVLRTELPDGATEDKAREAWDKLWDRETGYMTIGERILSDRGVHVDSLMKYGGDFSPYSRPVYTLKVNVGRLSVNTADVYVPIDFSKDEDPLTAVVNAQLMNGYAKHPKFLRDAMGDVVSDFVSQVYGIVQNEIDRLKSSDERDKDQRIAALQAFARANLYDVDRVEDGVIRRGKGMTPASFTTLASAFALFRAEASSGQSPYAMAIASIAKAVRKSPGFVRFLNLVDLTLGGNGFLDELISGGRTEDADMRGIRKLMYDVTGNRNAFQDAVSSIFGASGVDYAKYMEACVTAAKQMVRSGVGVTPVEGPSTAMRPPRVAVRKAVSDEALRLAEAEAADESLDEDERRAAQQAVNGLHRSLADTKDVESAAELSRKIVDAERKSVSAREKLNSALKSLRLSREEPGSESSDEAELAAGIRSSAAEEADSAEHEAASLRTELRKARLPNTTAVVQSDAKGGRSMIRTALGNLRKLVNEDADGEDESDFSIGVTSYQTDVPEVFRMVTGEEDVRFRRGIQDTDDHEMTTAQARLAVNVLTRTVMSLQGDDGVSESEVIKTAKRMFPGMTADDLAQIRDRFREAVQMKLDLTAETGHDVGWDFGTWDVEDTQTSSDNYNRVAVSTFESRAMKDFLVLAQKASPETGRNFMAFVNNVREFTRVLEDRVDAGTLKFTGDALANFRFTYDFLNPRTAQNVTTARQAISVFEEKVDRLGSSDFASRLVGTLFGKTASAQVSRKCAFLFSYMASLPSNVRARFASEFSNSVSADAVKVGRSGRIERTEHASYRMSENVVTDSFAAFVGRSPVKVAQVLRTIDSSFDPRSLAKFRKSDAKAIIPEIGEGDAVDLIEYNGRLIADALAEGLGDESPIVSALRSPRLIAHLRSLYSVGGSYRSTIDGLAEGMSLQTVTKDAPQEVDVMNVITKAMELLSTGDHVLGRTEVTAAFTSAFVNGDPTRASLTRSVNSSRVTSPLFTLMSLYDSSLPDTVRTADVDQTRTKESPKVAVAGRGVVPAVNRMMDLYFESIVSTVFGEVDAKTLARCRQDMVWPDRNRTPIIAKSLSRSLTPAELLEACEESFDSGDSQYWWVPLYAGDHGSSILLQFPKQIADRMTPEGEIAVSFKEFKEANPWVTTVGKDFVNHSGGARGSDENWGKYGSVYGVVSSHYYIGSKTPAGNVRLGEAEYKEGAEHVRPAVEALGRGKFDDRKDYVRNLLARNWFQVKNADEIFAIGTLEKNGKDVAGGTGYAVQMAKVEGKPIHLFDQRSRRWMAWNGSSWDVTDTPVLTKNFAGIGTRELTTAGRTAIKNAYRKTFGLPEFSVGATFADMAEAAGEWVGLDLLSGSSAAKRSAPFSLEAEAVSMTGVKGYDSAGNPQFGENRMFIVHTYDPSFSNEELKGNTIIEGYGARQMKMMAQDPASSLLKVHLVSTGGDYLSFIKSLSVSESDENGMFIEGSALRALTDFLKKNVSAEHSTGVLTDYDSYKVGPATTAVITDESGDPVVDGKGNPVTVLSYVLDKFKGKVNGDVSTEEIDAELGTVWIDGAQHRVSEILPGIRLHKVDGLSTDMVAVSFLENEMMGYTVANVSHEASVPSDPGRTPRNHEIDALAMARSLVGGGYMHGTEYVANDLINLIADWGVAASSVISTPEFIAAYEALSGSIRELARYGENPNGQNIKAELLRAVNAQLRKNLNIPLDAIDAALVTSGALAGKSLADHSKSMMHRGLHRGAEVFREAEKQFYGVDHRVADCGINCIDPRFRHGWFLDEDAFLKACNDPESLMNFYMKSIPESQRSGRSRDEITLLALENMFTDLRSAQSDPARKAHVKDLRYFIASVFMDHHGRRILDKQQADGSSRPYYMTVSFEDLFRADVVRGRRVFDRSAVNIGSDRIVNSGNGNKKMIYLGGTMFGLPRTPSYNGSMWLQVVRASLPVTEIKDQLTGEYSCGRDAMVQPDPYTLNILGCDHDGDKTKAYMLFTGANDSLELKSTPDADGIRRDVSIPSSAGIPFDDFIRGGQSRKDYFERCRSNGMLQRYMLTEDGDQVAVEDDGSDLQPGEFYGLSKAARRHASNRFVLALFDMARVVPSTGETGEVRTSASGRVKMFGAITARETKASPIAKSLLKDILSLPVVPPSALSKGRLVNPYIAAEVSTGALDASDARANVVSTAQALHIAWASGAFLGGDRGLFGINATTEDWFNFIYHLDGLSNATFDDLKEQLCSRLGWTSGMIDAVVTDLIFSLGRLPTTDEDFAAILTTYVKDVNTEGTARHWMKRATDVVDRSFARDVGTMIGLEDPGRMSASALHRWLGVIRKGETYEVADEDAPGSAFLRAIVRSSTDVSEDDATRMIADAWSGRGHSPAAGYLAYMLSGKDTWSESKFADEARRFLEWRDNLQKLSDVKDFAQAVNYMNVDAGSDLESGRRDRVAGYWEKTSEYLNSDPDAAASVKSDRLNMSPVLERMHATTLTAYSLADDIMTVATRGVLASNRHFDNLERTFDTGTASQLIARSFQLDILPDYMRMELEANAQQIPYVISALAHLPHVDGSPVQGGEAMYGLLKGMATGVTSLREEGFDARALNLRRAIESAFELMYRLATTSSEHDRNNAFAYFRSAEDTAYSKPRVSKGKPVKPYGDAGDGLYRIQPTFRANSEESVARIRRLVADIISGKAFSGTRESRFVKASGGRGRVVADSFVLNSTTLDEILSEAGDVETKNLVDVVRSALAGAEKELHLDSGTLEITPAMMFGQLLPLYSVITSRTLGAPSPTSPSLLNLLPRDIYAAISTGQVLNDLSCRAAVNSLVPCNFAPRSSSLRTYYLSRGRHVFLYDKDGKPVKGDDVRARKATAEAGVRDFVYDGTKSLTSVLRKLRRDMRGGDDVTDVRQNPDYRNTIDLFAANDVLLEAVKVIGRVPAEERSAPRSTLIDDVFAGTDVVRRVNPELTFKPEIAAIARMAGAAFGTWAEVSYTGGDSFVITGRLRGDLGSGHRATITVSVGDIATANNETDVENLANSRSFAASFCAAAGYSYHGSSLTADQFMLLPLDVRKALVRRYQVGAATANRLSWSIDGNGLATLAGAIRLNGTGNATKLYHEYFHSMMKMFYATGALCDEDVEALRQRFGEPPAGKDSTWLFNEDVAAEEFRKWVGDRTNSSTNSITEVFRKIYDFLASLFKAIKYGFGYTDEDSDDILFGMMMHGYIQSSSAARNAVAQEGVDVADVIRESSIRRLSEYATAGSAAEAVTQAQEELERELSSVPVSEPDPVHALGLEYAEAEREYVADTVDTILGDRFSRSAVQERLEAILDFRIQTLGDVVPTIGTFEAEGQADFIVDNPMDDASPETSAARAAVAELTGGRNDTSLLDRAASVILDNVIKGLKSDGSVPADLSALQSSGFFPKTKGNQISRPAVLRGIRTALRTIDPAAEAALDSKTIRDSVAFRVALSAYQMLESSYVDQDSPRRVASAKMAADWASVENLSYYGVSGWLLSSRAGAPVMIVDQALKVIGEQLSTVVDKKSPAYAEISYCKDQISRIKRAISDQTGLFSYRDGQLFDLFNEVIPALKTGTKKPQFDEDGRMKDIMPIDDPDSTNNGRVHYDMLVGCWEDPRVQTALKTALTTAYQLAAMVKFMRSTDSVPFTAEDVAFQNQMLKRGHAEAIGDDEWAASQSIGDSMLLDNRNLVDFYDQSFFIADNVDAYLRSLVRKSFGRVDFSEIFASEHQAFAEIKSDIARLENYYSFLFGDNVMPGGEILKVLEHTSEFKMEDGTVVHRVGGKYIRFDNYNRVGCGVTMTEDDLRMIDLFKKSLSAYAAHQDGIVTGVHRISFNEDMSDDVSDYTEERIKAREEAVNSKNRSGRPLNAFEMACWRILEQVPGFMLHGENGVYDRFVRTACDAIRRTREELSSPGRDAPDFNTSVLRKLETAGVIAAYETGIKGKDSKPVLGTGVLLIDTDMVDEMFRRSGTYEKLVSAKGGRTPEMLSRDKVTKDFMNVFRKAARFAKQHAWLTEGDGRYLNMFGTPLPFFKGTGVFMYNAARRAREDKRSFSARMNKYEQSYYNAVTKYGLTTLQDPGDAPVYELLSMLHDAWGLPKDGAALRDAILAGEYEDRGATDKPYIPRTGDLTVIATSIYERLLDNAWMEKEGYSLRERTNADRLVQIYEDNVGVGSDMFGGSVGMNDIQMFRKHGVLPANDQLGHKVHKTIDGITNALMQRGTMASLLMTPSSDGAPVYYADPDDRAAELGGLPDEFWSNLAHWWADYNRDLVHKDGSRVLVYDESRSGIQNARAMYRTLDSLAKAGHGRVNPKGPHRYVNLPPGDNDLESVVGWLVQTDEQRGNDSSALNALAGGEAMGYLKHLTSAGRVLGFGGAKTRATLHRALSWSKAMAVSFSRFFPIATRFESPTGAVGGAATLVSNSKRLSDIMREHPDLFNALTKMLPGGGWFTKDFLGFSDVLEMMDSNDPFIAELVSWAHALGITMSDNLVNPMEQGAGIVQADIKKMEDYLRRAGVSAEHVGTFSRAANVLLTRSGEKAFTYALNATKLAVVAQMAMKLRHEATARGVAFDPVRDLRRYSRYINAEVGGLDMNQYAWATPFNRGLLGTMMFSWQWTRSAWEAGGGAVLEDFLLGGHSLTKEERSYILGRWARMFCAVMVGAPLFFQPVINTLAWLINRLPGGPGDDRDRMKYGARNGEDAWLTFNNESKHAWFSFDMTPLLRAISNLDIKFGLGENRLLMGDLKKKHPLLLALVPAYTGSDASNSKTGNRRYYMHFGKQGWEFFRWFTSPGAQLASKLSMPAQKVLEGVLGRSLSMLDIELPWSDKGALERWIDPSTDGATFNLAKMFLPFSVNTLSTATDVGFLGIYGPVSSGMSWTAMQDAMVTRWTEFANNDRRFYRFGYKHRGRVQDWAVSSFSDIMQDAMKNGVTADQFIVELARTAGRVRTKLYDEFFRLLPEEPDGDVDTKELNRLGRAINRVGGKRDALLQSIKRRLDDHHVDWRTIPNELKTIYRDTSLRVISDPFNPAPYSVEKR